MKVKLFTDGSYYYAPVGAVCDSCSASIFDLGWLHLSWFEKRRGRHPEERVFCHNCFDKDESFGADVPEYKAFVVDAAPRGAVPYFPRPPSLADAKGRGGELSTFDVGLMPQSEEQDDVSKVRFAGRPEASLEGATVGMLESEVRDPNQEFDPLLTLTAVPVVDDTRLLGGRS